MQDVAGEDCELAFANIKKAARHYGRGRLNQIGAVLSRAPRTGAPVVYSDADIFLAQPAAQSALTRADLYRRTVGR